MAGNRILYLQALIGAVVFYMAYQKWFSWIVLLAVLFLPFLSLLLSLYSMLKTRIRLTVPERVSKGSEAKIQLDVYGSGARLPVNCRVHVHVPNTGTVRKLGSVDTLSTDLSCGYVLYPRKTAVLDYLGIFARKIRNVPSCTVRVLPEPLEVPLTQEFTQNLITAWKPKKGSSNAENHEIRPYRPGDPMPLVHWKLSAKMDALMLREPMEPDQGIMLMLDINGTPDALDRKYGRLLWLGNWLLEREVPFTVTALTGEGIRSWPVRDTWELDACIDALLIAPFAPEGSVRDRPVSTAWQIYIGGDPDAV